MGVSKLTERVIEYSFYLLIFLVPIIWLPFTSELFEFNKMILVYLATIVVLTAWVLKSVEEKEFTLKRTPLDIPILIFLIANIFSTIFSIDTHTSIFGYYSRFNGGLLSTFSYVILFYSLVTFFDKEKLMRLLKILLFSSSLVAIYGILQHPNPLFRNPDGTLRGIDADYWRQNSQARVFSTLGHPNWLAAFLLMITPFALFFLIYSRKIWEKVWYVLLLITLFLTFTFTYSRGGTVGFVVMMLVLIIGLAYIFRSNMSQLKSLLKEKSNYFLPPQNGFFVSIVLIGWVITFLFFGNAFTTRGIDFASITAEGETQLASYGAETGRIRLIVWKGGLDIFKSYPIFGSGVETFAYSYYLFRPAEHNLTGEWDFFYNKAHNEFVNFLSTTGGVGFISYMAIIITFTFWLLMKVRLEKEVWKKFFAISALSGFAGYHAQNVFSFSVVAIALLYFLLPGFVFIIWSQQEKFIIKLNFIKTSLRKNLVNIGIFTVGTVLIIGVIIMWVADYYYTIGISTSNLSQSYQNLKLASLLRPDEPLYKAELGLTTLSLGTASKNSERKQRISEGFGYLNQATGVSPNNINIVRIRMEAIYGLSDIDERYTIQSVATAKKLAELAPTEAKIQYNLAVMYVLTSDPKKAQEQLQKTIALKFNYQTAWNLLLKVESQLHDAESLNKHIEKYKTLFPLTPIKEVLED